MSKPPATAFNGNADKFNDYERSVRGAIRYELTHANLLPYTEPGLDAIDCGGGSGPDSAWLSQQGCIVTLVEPAADQLAIAARRFSNLSEEDQKRITPMQGEVTDLSAECEFDMALSHGVAMYLEDPNAYWESILTRLKPGGLLSVLEKSFDGAEARFLQAGDHFGLRKFRESGGKIIENNMDRKVQAFTFEDIEASMKQLGGTVIAKAGVRYITENYKGRYKSEYSQDDWSELFDREYTVGRDPALMHACQMLHVVVRKN